MGATSDMCSLAMAYDNLGGGGRMDDQWHSRRIWDLICSRTARKVGPHWIRACLVQRISVQNTAGSILPGQFSTDCATSHFFSVS